MSLRAKSLFRPVWWLSNVLLAVALVATGWFGMWEFSVRQYVEGFSDAIVSDEAPPQLKVEAILAWMSHGPQRLSTDHPEDLSPRDPLATLNYQQLLNVCGSATNAFLNLSRHSRLETRRLLLLTPERTTKHVVAEVHLDGRWVIVDPTYRLLMKDAKGNLLTRKDLQNPAALREATSSLPDYPPNTLMIGLRTCALRRCRSMARESGRSWIGSSPAGKNIWTGVCSWSAVRSCISFSPPAHSFF